MALSVLSQASALNPGSDLWVLPDAAHSRWSMKIDWYLNFQISRAQRHRSRPLPSELQDILDQTCLPVPERPALKELSPLLISSAERLPNRWVAVLPFSGDDQLWVRGIAEAWTALQSPGLRVFLPPGQSAGGFNELWRAHHKFEDFTVVLD